MFFFSAKKNKDKPQVKEEKPRIEPTVSDSYDWNEKSPAEFLAMMIDSKVKIKAMLIDVAGFKNPKSTTLVSKALDEVLLDFARNVQGRIFELANKSVLLVFKNNFEDEFQALLIRLQFAFQEELTLARKADITDTDFLQIYETPEQLKALKNKIVNSSPYLFQDEDKNQKVKISGVFTTISDNNKKKLRELSPAVLDKMQKSLQRVDFSSLIRRQAVCAVIGKSAPQMIFEEVYVSIPDLRDILLPDVNLTSNPWLFMHLTETLDKRVLAHVSKHDDGSLVSNFSMNLNVSTILSDDFLEFDESIPPQLRSTIVLELQLVDIFNDVKAFLLAKAFAQYRGYKICIDGITVDKLQYINRENLNSDLMKIFWHPSFLDVINEDKHFKDYVNKAERAKMILCRVDDAKAIEVGNSIGINLYQGRYVQRELNRRRKS